MSLYSTLCLTETLLNAWKTVKTKNSAGGIDGLSVVQFTNDIRTTLENKFSLNLNPPVITDLETGTEFLGICIKRSGLSLTEKKKNDLENRIDSIRWEDARLTDKSKQT